MAEMKITGYERDTSSGVYEEAYSVVLGGIEYEVVRYSNGLDVAEEWKPLEDGGADGYGGPPGDDEAESDEWDELRDRFDAAFWQAWTERDIPELIRQATRQAVDEVSRDAADAG
jgi:hypothetical protein